MKPNDILAKSIATQDQEWGNAREWFNDPANASASVALTVASIAEDSGILLRLMQQDERYVDVVQRMVALVVVEVLNRHIESGQS